MDIVDRMGDARDRIRRERSAREMEDVRRENQRLKAEARVLEDELQQDRGDVERLLSVIERTSGTEASERRFGRFVALATVATGAYVMGAKAGRERYDEIRRAAAAAMRRGSEIARGLRERADEMVDETQAMASRVSDAGQVVGDTVRAVAEGPVTAEAGVRASISSRPA